MAFPRNTSCTLCSLLNHSWFCVLQSLVSGIIWIQMLTRKARKLCRSCEGGSRNESDILLPQHNCRGFPPHAVKTFIPKRQIFWFSADPWNLGVDINDGEGWKIGMNCLHSSARSLSLGLMLVSFCPCTEKAMYLLWKNLGELHNRLWSARASTCKSSRAEMLFSLRWRSFSLLSLGVWRTDILPEDSST